MFTIGAMLLMGGWGLTGYVDAYQHAAGAAAGVRWREGEQETTATLRRSSPVRTAATDGSTAGGEPTPDTRSRSKSKSAAKNGLSLTRQVLPPSSWLYALGDMTMMTGAGLMALMIPWRGARMAAAAEAVPQQHYMAPAAPITPMDPVETKTTKATKASKPAKAPKPPKASKAAKLPAMGSPPAPTFPGLPPLQDAQSSAAAPMQESGHAPLGKTGVKPLMYKKGA
jgi:putative endonuclease